MADKPLVSVIETYFKRFQFQEPQLKASVSPDTRLIVVIPCYNEKKVIRSLESLANAQTPQNTAIEVITVVNHAIHSEEKVKLLNKKTLDDIDDFAKKNNSSTLKFHSIRAFDLPKKHAGVGLARKIGMDEALNRFKTINHNGIIVCFDADSLCETNYFTEIIETFNKFPKANGASIHFEHPTQGDEYPQEIYDAIIDYELHLRYYKNAVQFTGTPFSYHTIGSSMAVKAESYAKQGGMNKRKAGEDFYFLNKIIQLGNFIEINSTKVIPSPRVSDRVPFGTGKAVGDILSNNVPDYLSYSFDAFIVLKKFFDTIPLSYQQNNFEQLPTSIQDFIGQKNYTEIIEEIKKNTSNITSYTQRFYNVFDSFWILKFVHYYRDNHKKNEPTTEECQKLLKAIYPDKQLKFTNKKELLEMMKKVDLHIL